MNKHIVVSALNIETNLELSLEELCVACKVTPEFIQELVEYGILDLSNTSLAVHRFNPLHLRRVRTVAHLKTDLDVNLPGAALVIELMEKMDDMRTKIEMYEKYLFITR
jgi:chaperone modulatory protein CbpM